MARRLNFKLSQRYYGPFQIYDKVGAVAYKLKLPTDSKIHLVFHVVLLKEFQGEPPEVITSLPEAITIKEVGPHAIVDQRITEDAG